MKNKSVQFITQAAVIAAMYAALTILQNVLIPGSASAAIQFRVAEALAVLAMYTPAAIPGLAVGCLVANLSSVTAGLGVLDLIFGPVASLLAALAMYGLRRVRLFNLPILGLCMPALFNGLIVGFEIELVVAVSNITDKVTNEFHFGLAGFLTAGGFVAIGELAVLFVLGLPLSILLDRKGRSLGITEPQPKEE